jgi:hypothetical protein
MEICTRLKHTEGGNLFNSNFCDYKHFYALTVNYTEGDAFSVCGKEQKYIKYFSWKARKKNMT